MLVDAEGLTDTAPSLHASLDGRVHATSHNV
jgi:hypothetical protein